ncbi:TetR/AcrR family transcriptional regulator [Nocardia thailandica]|uniref:TetR/AcrR family transcriptional regulator n=1 Tax=Nocardia thailandica TaxID=257275 RepID=A0ABW6PGH9_9NOCA
MTESTSHLRQLPRGRHRLSREEVVASQRERILVAMGEAMTEGGYVGTPVAAILKRAGVSRETFYEQFRSKEECFEAAFDRASGLLAARLQEVSIDPSEPPLDRLDHILEAYLRHLVDDPAAARLYLVEVFAVGPAAIAERMALLERFVDVLATVLGASTPEQRFACEMLASGIGGMVTGRIAAEDLSGLLALREPILELARRSGALFGTALT